MSDPNNTPSAGQVLVPVALIAFVLFLSLSFQTVQVLHDRNALHQLIAQQDKPLEDSRKLQAQLSGLALGTKKLAEGGNKHAAEIIARLQQLGISVGDQPAPGAAGQTPVPTPAP